MFCALLCENLFQLGKISSHLPGTNVARSVQ
jgi:hypothetical protein